MSARMRPGTHWLTARLSQRCSLMLRTVQLLELVGLRAPFQDQRAVVWALLVGPLQVLEVVWVKVVGLLRIVGIAMVQRWQPVAVL